MKVLPRVYILDDDEQMRILLNRLLSAEYDVMCFAAAQHFLDVAAALPSGCLILDMLMPELNGLEVQRRLAERKLHFPTIIITAFGQVNIAVQAMQAGAIDFVEKPFKPGRILESIRLAQQHLASAGMASDNAEVARRRLATLSAREREILNGLVAGLPNKTIAYDLGISPRTVEMHRAHIMKKMEAGSLSALVRAALAAEHSAEV
jgi:two-component system, LuxR family, response regulator FixJ